MPNGDCLFMDDPLGCGSKHFQCVILSMGKLSMAPLAKGEGGGRTPVTCRKRKSLAK